MYKCWGVSSKLGLFCPFHMLSNTKPVSVETKYAEANHDAVYQTNCHPMSKKLPFFFFCVPIRCAKGANTYSVTK